MIQSRWPYLICLSLGLLLACGKHPYTETMLDRAQLEGKDKSWFEKNWGRPSGKAARLFGGETWTYFRLSGQAAGPTIFNYSPTQCQVTLKFDDEDKLQAIDSSGC